jgi:uncharacterized protein (DUF983 family)
MGAGSRRNCPECSADSIPLSLSNVKRARRVTCNACGASLEVVIPSGIYAAVTLLAVIFGSMLVPTILMSMFEKKWTMVALAIALLFVLIFGTNVLLNRRATVQRPGGRG